MDNILKINNWKQFRKWLTSNHSKATECWVQVKLGEPKDSKHLYYIDAVEQAICFGWIDSIKKNDAKHGFIQKFSPRKPNSNWTQLNIERAKRLIKLGLMTSSGLKTLPDLNKPVVINADIKRILKDPIIAKNFNNFPDLYKRIRIDSIQRYKSINKDTYKKALNNFKKQTKANKMYGNWNDYGRLLDN